MFLFILTTYTSSLVSGDTSTNLLQIEDQNKQDMLRYINEYKKDCKAYYSIATKYFKNCNEVDKIDLEIFKLSCLPCKNGDPEISNQILEIERLRSERVYFENEADEMSKHMLNFRKKTENFCLPEENDNNGEWISLIKRCFVAFCAYKEQEDEFFTYMRGKNSFQNKHPNYSDELIWVDFVDNEKFHRSELGSTRKRSEELDKELFEMEQKHCKNEAEAVVEEFE